MDSLKTHPATSLRSNLSDYFPTFLKAFSARPKKGQSAPAVTPSRHVVHVTGGRKHGPITRLVSPSDIGQLIKPFVFLDHGAWEPTGRPIFGIHPHSGIATLTVLLSGRLAYWDSTGKSGEVSAGGLEWMKAGGGVWHDGWPAQGQLMEFYQLWVALPASEENAAAESQYVGPEDVQSDGFVRVILGRYGNATSPIRAPQGMNYFHVRLKAGQKWSYEPPVDHTVGWAAVHEGRLLVPQAVAKGELVVFDESNAAIELEAHGDTAFVIGSAVKHPHELVLGDYSVHTNAQALEQGETEIRRIGQQLRAEGD